MADPLDLDALEALAAKATPVPWLYHEKEMLLLPSPSAIDGGTGRYGWCGEAAGDDDGRYIVAACNSAPALVAEVRRLRAKAALGEEFAEGLRDLADLAPGLSACVPAENAIDWLSRWEALRER